MLTNLVGGGAYGVVAAVRDRRNDKFFAMKKLENPCYHTVIAKRALRELRILRFLNHENVILNHSIVLPNSRAEFSDM